MIQKRALRIIFPWVVYDEALSVTGLQKLSTRRQRFVDKHFREIESNDKHKLHNFRLNGIGKLFAYITH